MKKMFLSVLFLFPVAGFAQSDYSVTWNLVGGDFYDTVELDFNIGTAYVSANGAFITDTGTVYGVTGSCFINDEEMLFCDLLLALGYSGELIIDPVTLEGTYTEFDVDGFEFENSLAFLRQIN